MAQTTVQKTDSVRFGSGILEFDNGGGFTDIGMVTDVVLDVTKLIKEFVGANAKMDPLSRITEVLFNFTMYEIDLTFLELINGDFDLTNTPGVLVNVVGEALGTGWTVDQPIKLANKEGDNSEVANIVIDAAGSPLVLDTDYRVYVGDGDNGELGFTYIYPLTAQAGVLDADYDYTPLASKLAEFGEIEQELNLNSFRFTHTYADGKIFRITFHKAYNAEGLAITFQGDEDEDPASLPVSVKAFPDDTKTDTKNLFSIYDEKSVT